ncbi:MAG TPA: hypothetical protein VGD31_14990, partial [Sphingobacteriaceae bacterium]
VDFKAWLADRERHLENDLEFSQYSEKLYAQYRKHLGVARYAVLRAAQGIIVPARVRVMLKLWDSPATRLSVKVYKKLVLLKLDWIPKLLILPSRYVPAVKDLEVRS